MLNSTEHEISTIHKAKATNQSHHWVNFKRLRNEVTTLIRYCNQQHTAKITQKLKSENLSSKDWWSTLKAFISPQTHSAIPPFESSGNIYIDEMDKANLLNDHFQCQTILNEQNVILPPLPPPAYHTCFRSNPLYVYNVCMLYMLYIICIY